MDHSCSFVYIFRISVEISVVIAMITLVETSSLVFSRIFSSQRKIHHIADFCINGRHRSFVFNVQNFHRIRSFSSKIDMAGTTDSDLYEELREWRRRTSEELQRPSYTIFPNKVLEELVAKKPLSHDKFIEIKGIGPKTQRFSDSIIEIIQKYPSEPRIEPSVDSVVDYVDPAVWSLDESVKQKVKKKKKTVTKKAPDAAIRYVPNMKRININELSEEQGEAAKRALEGKNLFISGSAGTGKHCTEV